MSKKKAPRRLADNEARSVARLLRGSPQKLNLVAELIRGKDAGVDWALVVTGYDAEAVAGLEQADLAKLEGAAFGLYRTDYSLHELEAKRAHDPAR